MLDGTEQKEDEQVQKQKEMQNMIQNTRFNGTIRYSDTFLANNYNKLRMQLNSQYIAQVTQICCPRRVRGSLPHVRMRPYYIPQRSRTKSENSDPTSLVYLETIRTVDAAIGSSNPSSSTLMEMGEASSTLQMDTTSGGANVPAAATVVKCNSTLVKSKSLEDLVRAIKSIDGSLPSHEMEFMSSRIQKLKVQE